MSRMSGMACFMPRNTPSRLIDCCRRQSVSVMSRIEPAQAIPALLTRICNVFSFPAMSEMIACHVSSLATSCLRKRARPPFATMPLTTSVPPASLTSVAITRAPSRARVCAIARPMPEAAPVTNATRFCSLAIELIPAITFKSVIQIPNSLRFIDSSTPDFAKSSNARSVTRIMCSRINCAPSRAPSSGCFSAHSHSNTAQPGKS